MARVILAVCLNTALDLTYDVGALTPGSTHRASTVSERPGGKGLNVARVLHQLGEPVTALGFAGGDTGAAIRHGLAAAGIRSRLTPIAGSSRRCVTIVDPAGATVVNEPGPLVSSVEWASLLATFDEAVASSTVVVLSGSLPPGTPPDAYGVLTELARRAGARVVLDAEGPALAAALAAGPDLVKPNGHEAAAELGRPVVTPGDALEAAALLRGRGAGAAVVSLGADGLAASTPGGDLVARPPYAVAGNPTGAGDALAAALARGLAGKEIDWPALLADGVAVSAGAVARPTAGEVDLGLVATLHPLVDVKASA